MPKKKVDELPRRRGELSMEKAKAKRLEKEHRACVSKIKRLEAEIEALTSYGERHGKDT